MVSKDHVTVISGGDDGKLKIWDIINRRLIKELNIAASTIEAISLSKDDDGNVILYIVNDQKINTYTITSEWIQFTPLN